MYEVEQKYPISDPAAMERRLQSVGGIRGESVIQVDAYYNHPARDFTATDEALRIRRIGSQGYVTYKGPKIDQTTKTRREIEWPIADGIAGADQFAEFLGLLGFTPAAEVRKERTPWSVDWQSHAITIAVDQVERLGSYIELEIEADASQLDAARSALATLADHLGLTQSERRSYLELLTNAIGFL